MWFACFRPALGRKIFYSLIALPSAGKRRLSSGHQLLIKPSYIYNSQEVFNLGPLFRVWGEFSALTCVFVCFFFEKKKCWRPAMQGPPVIFSDNKVHTINIIIHFQIKLKNFLGPKILSFCIPPYIYILLLFYTYTITTLNTVRILYNAISLSLWNGFRRDRL